MVANSKLFHVFTYNFSITEPGGGLENTNTWNRSKHTGKKFRFWCGFGAIGYMD